MSEGKKFGVHSAHASTLYCKPVTLYGCASYWVPLVKSHSLDFTFFFFFCQGVVSGENELVKE